MRGRWASDRRYGNAIGQTQAESLIFNPAGYHKKLDPFLPQLGVEGGDTGKVAARPRETGHQPSFNRGARCSSSSVKMPLARSFSTSGRLFGRGPRQVFGMRPADCLCDLRRREQFSGGPFVALAPLCCARSIHPICPTRWPSSAAGLKTMLAWSLYRHVAVARSPVRISAPNIGRFRKRYRARARRGEIKPRRGTAPGMNPCSISRSIGSIAEHRPGPRVRIPFAPPVSSPQQHARGGLRPPLPLVANHEAAHELLRRAFRGVLEIR